MKFPLQYAKLLSQKFFNIDDDIIPEIEMCLEREGDRVSLPFDIDDFGIKIDGNCESYGYNYNNDKSYDNNYNNSYGDGDSYGYGYSKSDGDGDGDGGHSYGNGYGDGNGYGN